MTKIILTKSSWGNWSAEIQEDWGMESQISESLRIKDVNLDSTDVLLKALAHIGVEVEFKSHWYKTVTDSNGNQRGERVEVITSNLSK